MNLILIEPAELNARGEVTLTDRRAAHIRDILHGRGGQSLRVGLVNGPVGTGMIRALDGDTVTLRCVFGGAAPDEPPIDLLLALPRPKVMKRLWSPLAAIGVRRIFISNAEKVERYYFDSHVLEPSFYNGELKLGLEQAMDTRLPEVTVFRQLKPLVEHELSALCPDMPWLVSHPGSDTRISDRINPGTHRRLLMAVGPEGGWSGYELDLFAAHGFQAVGIGQRILRTDTACIALLALAHDALR